MPTYMATSTSDIDAISKRLGIVIALLLRSMRKQAEAMTLRDQVQVLANLGVRPKEIADILGRTQTYVTKELASLRKKKSKTDA